MQEVSAKRQTNIELLRIVSMLMIVFHHFAVHGGFEWEPSDVTLPHFYYNFIEMGGKIGVDIFVLISGYFLISSTTKLFNVKKIMKLWGQVFFYSIGFYLASILLGAENISLRSLIKFSFPITFSVWWFASAYIVLYIIHPYLNLLLKGLNRHTYRLLIVVLVFIWSIIPSVTPSKMEGNTLTWFITLYAISGYVKLYGFNKKLTSRHYFVLWFVFSILTYLSSIIFTILGRSSNFFFTHINFFMGMEKISTLLISVTLFMAFAKLKLTYNKWIQLIASATFGVYLIHDNKILRSYFWFKNVEYQHTMLIIPYSIMIVLTVYILCTTVDLCRKYTFERLWMSLVNKYADMFIKLIKNIVICFENLVFGI